MDIFDDARDDVDDVVEAEDPVEQSPRNSPPHQAEEAVEAQNAPAIQDQPVDNQQHPLRNRREPQRNRSRSRSRSPGHNPHQNSKYTVMWY